MVEIGLAEYFGMGEPPGIIWVSIVVIQFVKFDNKYIDSVIKNPVKKKEVWSVHSLMS
jgi:hypothetical protein